MVETVNDYQKIRFDSGYQRAATVLRNRPDDVPLSGEWLGHPQNRPLHTEAEAFKDGYAKRCREELELHGLPIPGWAECHPSQE
jgi:hypothetical protein